MFPILLVMLVVSSIAVVIRAKPNRRHITAATAGLSLMIFVICSVLANRLNSFLPYVVGLALVIVIGVWYERREKQSRNKIKDLGEED